MLGILRAASIQKFAQGAFDIAHRLLGAMLIFDQRKAHMLVAILAEADTRRNRNLC